MKLPFNEAKATQAAAVLLKRRGGPMSYLKLVKLLYLADREAILTWDRSITTDRYVSMEHGPVVSRIYALIQQEPEPGGQSFWRDHIRTLPAPAYEVELMSDPSNSELSEAEEALLERVFREHGKKSRWQLRDETHDLPEWTDPNGSSLPIEYRDILIKGGKRTEAEVAEVESELESLAVIGWLSTPLRHR